MHVLHKGIKTNVTVFDGWFFTGQLTAKGECEGQIDSVMQMAAAELKGIGTPAENVVKCDVLLGCCDDMNDAIKAYKAYISEDLPAFRFAIVPNMPDGMRIGLELTGVTGDSALKVERFLVDEHGIPGSVRAGEFIYTSAQLPNEKGSFQFEAQQVVRKTVEAIQAAGGQPSQVVKNFALLIEMEKFDAFNVEYAKTYTVAARSLIGVGDISGFQSAMDSIAYTGPDHENISVGALAGKMPFSSAVQAGSFLFGSGQIGVLNEDGTYNLELIPQTEKMLKVIQGVTETVNCGPETYLKCVGFATSQEYIPSMKSAMDAAFKEASCANAIFTIPFLANQAIMVEMETVAAVSERTTK